MYVRPVARVAVVATTILAVALQVGGTAYAAPTPRPVPTKGQVDRAKAAVADRLASVRQIEGELAAANARLQQAALDASIAAEAYNGAMWKLSESRKAYKTAKAQQAQAETDVAEQRTGIASLVTDSYQNGTELNSATAMMSGEGPRGLMNRYGVVSSAGDSMEAAYDAYRTAAAAAAIATEKAERAQKRSQGLAEEARVLRDDAQAAANNAALASGQIASKKAELVQALATAQNISVELAGKRQAALERVAAQKAAAAARVRQQEAAAAAKKAAAKQAALQAKKKATGAKQDHKQAQQDSKKTASAGGAGYYAPISGNPPAVGTGVKAVIAYAMAQVGKPYLWAAAGPNAFDCSGLTLMAWRQAGKSLPHWSVAQFAQSTRISAAQLRPGDLVFWGSTPGTIHHVAMYIGNGQIVHAPRTGQPVQVNSMYYWVPPDFFGRP